MGKRGPVSKAERAVNIVKGDFGPKRPEAPEGLTEDEAAIWCETCASEDPEFFKTGAQQALLKDYCRHRATTDRVSQIINEFKSDWLKNAEGAKRYRDLCRIRDVESRGAAEKATKLRLTNQSRYRPEAAERAARRANKSKLPWEFDGEED